MRGEPPATTSAAPRTAARSARPLRDASSGEPRSRSEGGRCGDGDDRHPNGPLARPRLRHSENRTDERSSTQRAMPFRRTLGSEEGEMMRMKRGLRMRELWASITTAVLLGAIVGFASLARAIQEWHLSLNDVNTTSGGNCGGSIVNPWDGTGDYLLGTYYDSGNSGLTFRYTYNDGDNWELGGAGFGDEVASGLYVFSGDGPDGAYEIPTWTHGFGVDTFIINPIGGSGALNFTCSF